MNEAFPAGAADLFPPAQQRGEDMFVRGQTRPGFYVASGSYDLIPRIMDGLVELMALESSSEMGEFPSPGRPPFSIGRLFWVDSGNMFDAYYMARRAAERGLDPHRVLRSVHVARPFTAFQYQEMLRKIPGAVSLVVKNEGGSPDSREGGIRPPLSLTPLVILSDVMGLFYDEELRDPDALRAFRDFLVHLRALKERATVIGLLMGSSPAASRRPFLPRVLQLARPFPSRLDVLSDVLGRPAPVFCGRDH